MRTLTFECSSLTAYRRPRRFLVAMFGAILLLPSMAGQAHANNPDKVDTDVTFNGFASNADGVGGSQMELGGAVAKAKIDLSQRQLRVSGSLDTAIASSSSRTYIARASQTEQYDPVLIREVQESLKRLGFYKGSIDGTLGRHTRRAINVFQRNAGLKKTGRPTDDVVALLRMRAKTATPHGRLLAKQGQLEAYVGPGRWCRGSIGVTIRASNPMAFYEDKNELQNVVSHLHEVLQNECPRFKRANIIGIAQNKQVYTAVLDKSGELKERNSGRRVSQAGGEASVCTTADPNSFDQVFACMSSARWTRGVSAGRNRFEGNIGTSDCRSIAAVYIDVLGKNGRLPRSVAVDRVPNCEIFARAVIEITGKPAYWASCVGYGSKPAPAHMTKCLESFVAGYYGGSTKVTDRVRGCATAIAEYEKGLKSADKNNRLPSSYTRPSCDVALAMISKWSGTTATASSCTGYDPGKVKSHVEQCFREEVKLSTLRNCGDVRRIYEERLVEAHGRLPRNYLMMPCSAATDLLARAEAERAEIAAKQRAATIEQQRRIAERQTAANRAIEMARQGDERPMKTYGPGDRPPLAPGTETEPAGQPSIARSAQSASRTLARPQQQSSGTTLGGASGSKAMAAGDGSADTSSMVSEGSEAYKAKDYARARALFDQACKGGNAKGCSILGVMFEEGKGGPQDKARARALYARSRALYDQACKGGFAESCRALAGVLYWGGVLDKARARALYDQACKGGFAEGCFYAGRMFDRGEGGARDYARARALYDQACKGGYARGCQNLDVMLSEGEGGAQDYAQATLALWKAIQNGFAATVRGLIAKGADVNAKDKEGLTVLSYATSNGHTEIVKALLGAGADIKAKDKDGQTTLMLAAMFGHTEIVKVMLGAAADVNAKDKKGFTALILATIEGHTEIVKALLGAGAEVNAKEGLSQGALRSAVRDGYREIVQLLKQAGLGNKRATVPLYESKVYGLWWGAMQNIYRVPRARREFIERQVREVMAAGQKVISCTYGPSDTVKQQGFRTYRFWYEDVPDNIYNMLSSAPNYHPMWHLGLKSVTACPESPELALRVLRSSKLP